MPRVAPPRAEGGGGRSRVLTNGAVIEKGGEVWMALQQGLIAPSAIEAELGALAAHWFDKAVFEDAAA